MAAQSGRVNGPSGEDTEPLVDDHMIFDQEEADRSASSPTELTRSRGRATARDRVGRCLGTPAAVPENHAGAGASATGRFRESS